MVENAPAIPSPAGNSSGVSASPLDGTAETLREAGIIAALIGSAALLYFLAAWFRYYAFRAGAMDLGFFDQCVYLISTGQNPYSTYLNYHILADHAAFILYGVALLYRIYPTVYWLLFVQAACMAGAAWPLWRLARGSGVASPMARAIVIAYLLYPVVATATLRDFYPEVFAVPALLAMILCARQRRRVWFVFWLLIGLSTKESIAITFAATGVFLAVVEHGKGYGLTALILSVAWALIATKLVMPHFGRGHENNNFRFFDYMGNTPKEIVHTALTRPQVPLRWLASKKTAIYLLVIFAPIFWGLSRKSWAPLFCAAPCIALNLFSNNAFFRNPFFHYSWPVVPFVFLGIVGTMADQRGFFKRGRTVIIWSVGLVLIGLVLRGAEVSGKQLRAGATGSERRQVLAMINDQGGLLGTHQTATHLSERKVVQYVYDPADPTYRMPPEDQIDWVYLDFNEDSVQSVEPFARQLLHKYQTDPEFREIYHQGALYLFHRESQE